MTDIEANEAPVAICFLGKDNDKKNQCLLMEKRLQIIRKGRTSRFLLEDIVRLSIASRKMMLPLIMGGIFAPLSIIAISKNLFEPWGILIWFMLNLLLLYLGWTGYKVLSVELKEFHQDFPIKQSGANLKAFIQFTNEYLKNRMGKAGVSPVYHLITYQDWEVAKQNQRYFPSSLNKEGFIHLSTKDQVPLVLERYFKNQKDILLLQIDPLKLTSELKYEAVYEKEDLYPHLYGPLNVDAVVNAEALKS